MKIERVSRQSPLCRTVATDGFCPRTVASSRAALRTLSLGVILLFGTASSGLTFAQSFYRDCIGAVMAADVAHQKAEANYRLCAAVAASATEMPVIRARMKSTAEAVAAFGYLEPFHEYGHAYYSLYKYYGFSNPRNVNDYLAIGFAWRDYYRGLAESQSFSYREIHSAEMLALATAQQSSLPEDSSQIDAHRRRVALEDANFWIALYGTHWAQTKWHYNTGLAQHSYNVWSYYAAPLYGTYAYFSQLLWTFVQAEVDAGTIPQYSLRRDFFPNEPTPTAIQQAYDAVSNYYDPVKAYYGALVDYYRDLTEEREG